MKVKMNQPLRGWDGDMLKHQKDGIKDGPLTPMLLLQVCCNALMGKIEGERLDGTEMVKRQLLAQRVYQAVGPVELSIDEVQLIKNLVAATYGTTVVGPTLLLLEPPPVQVTETAVAEVKETAEPGKNIK